MSRKNDSGMITGCGRADACPAGKGNEQQIYRFVQGIKSTGQGGHNERLPEKE